MKKILFITALLSIALFSCKKEQSSKTQPKQKTSTVHFKINGFSQSKAPIQTNSLKVNSVSGDSLKSVIDVLYYLVYRNNIRYHKITQYSTDPDFGTITDTFDTNTYIYKVVVVAGKTNLVDTQTGTNPDPRADRFQYINNGTVEYVDDTFYKTIEFTLPDSGFTYNLTLDRVVSQLQVNIEDAIPANAKYLTATFNDYQTISALNGSYADDFATKRTVTYSVTPGTINTCFAAILLNIGNSFNVEIKCTDAANNVLANKTVVGVTCKVNATTVLTGKLFGSPGSAFTITYNPAWGETIPLTF